MTLTYPALARADEILWLVAGAGKHEALARLLAGDRSIPAGRVEAGRSVILADASAVRGDHLPLEVIVSPHRTIVAPLVNYNIRRRSGA
jgi:hypothetical protein